MSLAHQSIFKEGGQETNVRGTGVFHKVDSSPELAVTTTSGATYQW